jgi:hypothetical protein
MATRMRLVRPFRDDPTAPSFVLTRLVVLAILGLIALVISAVAGQ